MVYEIMHRLHANVKYRTEFDVRIARMMNVICVYAVFCYSILMCDAAAEIESELSHSLLV